MALFRCGSAIDEKIPCYSSGNSRANCGYLTSGSSQAVSGGSTFGGDVYLFKKATSITITATENMHVVREINNAIQVDDLAPGTVQNPENVIAIKIGTNTTATVTAVF